MQQILRKFIIPSVALVMGVVVAVLSVGKLKKQGVYPGTTAVITRIEEDWDGEDTTYHVFVRYTVAGREYESELDEYKASFTEGKEIPVQYNPDDPAEVLSASKGTTYLAVGIGCVIGLAGLFLLVRSVGALIYAAKKRTPQ